MHIIKLVIYLNIILSAFFLWIELLKYLTYFLVVRFNYEDWLQRVVNIIETTRVYVAKHKLCILNIIKTHKYMYIYTCHAMLSNFSHVRLFATPWTVAYQAPLSLRFPRQEYWSGLHFPLQGILLTQGSNPCLLHWQGGSLPLSYQGSMCVCMCVFQTLWNFSSWKMRQHGHCF